LHQPAGQVDRLLRWIVPLIAPRVHTRSLLRDICAICRAFDAPLLATGQFISCTERRDHPRGGREAGVRKNLNEFNHIFFRVGCIKLADLPLQTRKSS
jgi:hypothetical protein